MGHLSAWFFPFQRLYSAEFSLSLSKNTLTFKKLSEWVQLEAETEKSVSISFLIFKFHGIVLNCKPDSSSFFPSQNKLKPWRAKIKSQNSQKSFFSRSWLHHVAKRHFNIISQKKKWWQSLRNLQVLINFVLSI